MSLSITCCTTSFVSLREGDYVELMRLLFTFFFFFHDHTRHLLLLQGLFEDQQQGLGSGSAGAEGEKQAAGGAGRVPPETSKGSVLRAGRQELQAQETGWFVCLRLLCSSRQHQGRVRITMSKVCSLFHLSAVHLFFFFFCHSSSSLNLCTATLCSSWTCWPTCSLTA